MNIKACREGQVGDLAGLLGMKEEWSRRDLGCQLRNLTLKGNPVTWGDLEDIMLSEVSQTKDEYCPVSLYVTLGRASTKKKKKKKPSELMDTEDRLVAA